jgi:hypothetical protein
MFRNGAIRLAPISPVVERSDLIAAARAWYIASDQVCSTPVLDCDIAVETEGGRDANRPGMWHDC